MNSSNKSLKAEIEAFNTNRATPDLCSERAEGSLFSNRAISLHFSQDKILKIEKSMLSFNKCGQKNGEILKFCGCEPEIVDLKHKCNLRTCPRCSKFRKRRLRRQYLPFLKGLAQDRTYQLYFLTISPKNYDNLEEGMKHIRQTFTKFLRHDYIKERIKAGIYVIESKSKNDSGLSNGWNIHIHAIIYGRRIDNNIRGKCVNCGQNLIKRDFITKKYYCANKQCNSLNVVYKQDSKTVKLWKQSSKRDVNIHITRQSSSSFTLNYMLKYISANKDDFADEKDNFEYIAATYKRKLINTFGLFYKCNFQIEEDKHICLICGCETNFTFDPDAIAQFCSHSHTAGPPDLFDY